MSTKIRSLLDYQISIAELIAIGVILGIPYLVIGGIWAATHTEHLNQMHGADLAVSFLGSIASWPVLLFSDICMA